MAPITESQPGQKIVESPMMPEENPSTVKTPVKEEEITFYLPFFDPIKIDIKNLGKKASTLVEEYKADSNPSAVSSESHAAVSADYSSKSSKPWEKSLQNREPWEQEIQRMIYEADDLRAIGYLDEAMQLMERAEKLLSAKYYEIKAKNSQCLDEYSNYSAPCVALGIEKYDNLRFSANHFKWKIYEDQESFLGRMNRLEYDFRHEKDPRKKKALEERLNQINQAMHELALLEKEGEVFDPNEMTTTKKVEEPDGIDTSVENPLSDYRYNTRDKFILASLELDLALSKNDPKEIENAQIKLTQVREEIAILKEVDGFLKYRAEVRQKHLSFYGYTSYAGLIDFSEEGREAFEARMKVAMENDWSAFGKGYLSALSPYEIPFDSLEKKDLSQTVRRWKGDNPDRLQAAQRGTRWTMDGASLRKNARKVRDYSPYLSFDLTGEVKDYFEFPVYSPEVELDGGRLDDYDPDKRLSLQEIQKLVKEGRADLEALDELLKDVEKVQLETSLTSNLSYFAMLEVKEILPQMAVGKQFSDFFSEIQTQLENDPTQMVNTELLAREMKPKLKAYLKGVYDSRKAEWEKAQTGYSEHATEADLWILNQHPELWEEAIEKGGLWNVKGCDGYVIEHEKQTNPYYEDLNAGAYGGQTIGGGPVADEAALVRAHEVSPERQLMWKQLAFAKKNFDEIEGEFECLTEKIDGAQELKDYQEVVNDIQWSHDNHLDRSLEMMVDEVEVVAKKGESKPSGDDQKAVENFRNQANEIRNEKDLSQKLKMIQSLKEEMEKYTLKVTLEQIREQIVGKGGDADNFFALFKEMGQALNPFDSEDDSYLTQSSNHFEPFGRQVDTALALLDKDDVAGARKILGTLAQSEEMKIVIERAKSSGKWKGIIIGVGIVAISILTAGVATELLLPVAPALVGEIGFGLAAGRFMIMASTFWATDKALTAWWLDEPIWESGKGVGGNLLSLGKSYLVEGILFFAAMSVAGRGFQRVLARVLVPGAEALAIGAGEMLEGGVKLTKGGFSKLSQALQNKYLAEYVKGMGRGGKAAIWFGAETTNIVALNLWSAITQKNYDIFSWETQSTLGVFLLGIKAVTPLNELILGGMRGSAWMKSRLEKLNEAELKKITQEMEALDGESLKIAKGFQKFVDFEAKVREAAEKNPETPIRVEDAEKLKLLKTKFTEKFVDLSRKRMKFMDKYPQLFEVEVRNEQKRLALMFEWMAKVQNGEKTMFASGNRWGLQMLKDPSLSGGGGTFLYNPEKGADLVRRLPEIFGEGTNPQIFIKVHENTQKLDATPGRIEVTIRFSDGKNVFGEEKVVFDPKLEATEKEIKGMRKAVPEKNQMPEIIDVTAKDPVSEPMTPDVQPSTPSRGYFDLYLIPDAFQIF